MSEMTLKTEGDKYVVVTRRFAASPEARRARIARRVGSASAEKAVSRFGMRQFSV